MPYQLALVAYLIVTTINSLLARRYATKTTLHPSVSGIPTGLLIRLPLSLLYALLTGGLMMPSLAFGLIALVESAIGVCYGVFSLYAQKHTDASTFTTLIKTHVLLVIGVSGVLLGESLSVVQLLGATLIMISGLLLSKGIHIKGFNYSLIAIPLLAGVVILSRIMIKMSSVGMYSVTAAIISLAIKFLFKGHEFRSNFKSVKKDFKRRAVLAVFTYLQVLLFNLSVDISGNVSLISSLASVKVITVMLASYIFLNERSNVRIKIAASIMSFVGLLLL